jgi:hypothetical protein
MCEVCQGQNVIIQNDDSAQIAPKENSCKNIRHVGVMVSEMFKEILIPEVCRRVGEVMT